MRGVLGAGVRGEGFGVLGLEEVVFAGEFWGGGRERRWLALEGMEMWNGENGGWVITF